MTDLRDGKLDDDAVSFLTAGVGGYDPTLKVLSPMVFEESDGPLYINLDVIAAACENGVLDSETWPSQLFRTEDDLRNFLDELSGYGDCYRLHDRWWKALFAISGRCDEEGFVSSEEIAQVLSIQAFHKLKAFKKPTAVTTAGKKTSRKKATA